MSGGRVYASQVGSGPDLVLVHGWGAHGGVWEDVVEILAEHCRVTVVDLPGHGYSRELAAGYDLGGLSRAVAEVAPPRAAWVGWSLGGQLALRLALDAPQRVDRLVLVGSSPCFVARPDWPHAMAAGVLHQFADGLRNDWQGTLRRFLALEVLGSDHAQEQLRALRDMVFQHGEPDPAALADGLAILETTDLRGELGHLRCPSLWLMGQRDNLVPAAAGAFSAALAPGGRSQVFERGGHAPFLAHAQPFCAAVLEFLHV